MSVVLAIRTGVHIRSSIYMLLKIFGWPGMRPRTGFSTFRRLKTGGRGMRLTNHCPPLKIRVTGSINYSIWPLKRSAYFWRVRLRFTNVERVFGAREAGKYNESVVAHNTTADSLFEFSRPRGTRLRCGGLLNHLCDRQPQLTPCCRALTINCSMWSRVTGSRSMPFW